MTTNSVNMY